MVSAHTKAHTVDIIFTWLSFLALAVFIFALSVKTKDYVSTRVNLILIISGVAVLLFLVIGKISKHNIKRSVPPFQKE